MMFSSGKHRQVMSYGSERPSPSYPLSRPLSNPPSPILVAFRSIEGRLTSIAAAADYWLSALYAFDAFGGFVHWEHAGHRAIIDATDEQRAHALAVFTRLAEISEEPRVVPFPEIKERVGVDWVVDWVASESEPRGPWDRHAPEPESDAVGYDHGTEYESIAIARRMPDGTAHYEVVVMPLDSRT